MTLEHSSITDLYLGRNQNEALPLTSLFVLNDVEQLRVSRLQRLCQLYPLSGCVAGSLETHNAPFQKDASGESHGQAVKYFGAMPC